MAPSSDLQRPRGDASDAAPRRGARPEVPSSRGRLALALAATLALLVTALASLDAHHPGRAVALIGTGAALGVLAARRSRRPRAGEGALPTPPAATPDAARDREDRLRSILSSLHEGVLLYDRHLQIVEFNAAAASILGLTADMVQSRPVEIPCWTAVHEDGSHWPTSSHPAATALGTGQPVSGATMGFQADGFPTRWLSVDAQPMEGADGSIEGVVVTFSDITDRRLAQDALRSSEARVDEAAEALIWHSFHDPLTHLPNRTLVLERISAALERARLAGSRSALLVLDLDRFKNVNDSMGHQAGDRLLVQMAERLRRTVRSADTVARLGGDEFVVLVESLSTRDEATELADRLRAAVAQPIELPSGTVTVTTSVGIAFDVDHEATSLLRDADTALYKAKDHGRDRWAVFDESLRAATVRRVAAEQLIRQALDQDGLRVHYQPIVDIASGATVGAEALLRIQGPHGALLAPSSFISIAEETGLIVPVGAGVLDEACEQLSLWRRHLGDAAPASVSVNLAARQLASGSFGDVVKRTLDRHGLEPSSLTMELTETTLIEAGRHAIDAVAAIHDLGVPLAIDDFGTGYSSLAYLKRFPVDIVKIDRSFVDGLGTTSSDTEIVRAVLALAQSLGLTTVAEGVETPEQLAALKALGCDRAQGYLFGRPVPPGQLGTSVDPVTILP